jgi:hypothetical protein
MGLIQRLLGEKRAGRTVECTSRSDLRRDDPVLLLREIQARVVEMRATVEAAQAQIRELGRRYPHTS